MSETATINPEVEISTDFDSARNWLLNQDRGTKDIFRQKIQVFLDSTYGVKYDDSELEDMKRILLTMTLSGSTREHATERMKRVREKIFGMQMDKDHVVTLADTIRINQDLGFVSKDLDPEVALENLVKVQSCPDINKINSLLTELKVDTYPDYLLSAVYEDGPSIKIIAKALSKANKRIQDAFFIGNTRSKLFQPNEIEEIKLEMEKLSGSQKKEA